MHDDRVLFESLLLEGAQAGLSWSTILNKREAYRRAYGDFDPARVARYDEREPAALLENPGIVRNRGKIAWSVRAQRAGVPRGGTRSAPSTRISGRSPAASRSSTGRAPSSTFAASTELSDRLSTDLRKRGFGFVGTTICYAFLQAVGVVDDHVVDCWRAQARPREGGAKGR